MTTEVQWSQLQRDPKSVAELADAGDVRVRRRDGAPLLLVREDRAESTSAGALTAARALRSVLTHISAAAADDILREEFPWIDVLPPADRGRFVIDFVRSVEASAELGQWAVLGRTITEWKATAAVHADPALHAELTGDLVTDLGPVPSPEGH